MKRLLVCVLLVIGAAIIAKQKQYHDERPSLELPQMRPITEIGKHIDIYFESHTEALKFGVKHKEVFIKEN